MQKTNSIVKVAAAGDILITRNIPAHNRGVEPVRRFLGRADVRAANLETTVTDGKCFASAFSGGTWLTAQESCLKDVGRYGFNLLGLANNHTMDYSYEGLQQTRENLDRYGFLYAGAGDNLYEASRPVMLETDGGRVGVIDICSTFDNAARAGMQTARMPGRPGLNPLRFSQVYRITKEQAGQLKEIRDEAEINCLREKHRSQGFLQPVPEGKIEFGTEQFEIVGAGEKTGRFSFCNPVDMERTVKSIEEALYTCEQVIVMVHSHEIRADEEWEADYFLEEFAHRCIDAGACAVIGSGSHQMKGIEFYKGCPIFYCLGNFIFQNESVRSLPADYMEQYGIDLHASGAMGIAVRSRKAQRTLYEMKEVYQTVLPYFEISSDGCTRMELLPVTLGFDRERFEKNLPYPASKEEAQEILAYLNRACARYDVSWKYEKGVFVPAEYSVWG